MEANPQAPAFQDDDDPRFVNRARIVLMEHDDALRLVTLRSLLRQGCVVRIKHALEQVLDDLQTGPVDGAVVDAVADLSPLAALQAANHRRLPIVVLTDLTVVPPIAGQFPSVRLLQRPFDMRELLLALHLPRGEGGE